MILNSFFEWDYCFFTMMGKYFSRKEIIKEMGSQLYSNENMLWYVLYNNINDVIGFASIEEKKDYYYLDNVYIIKKYRNNGYCKKIINKIINDNNKKPIKLIANNEIAIKMYKKYGFKEYGKNGSYLKMILNTIEK